MYFKWIYSKIQSLNSQKSRLISKLPKVGMITKLSNPAPKKSVRPFRQSLVNSAIGPTGVHVSLLVDLVQQELEHVPVIIHGVWVIAKKLKLAG